MWKETTFVCTGSGSAARLLYGALAGARPDYRWNLETAIDGITIGVNTDGEAALKNGRVVLSYPDALTLASAEAKLPAEAGITDLDTSKPGTLSFAWASYEPQGAVRLLEVTFQGKMRCCLSDYAFLAGNRGEAGGKSGDPLSVCRRTGCKQMVLYPHLPGI